jgi:hypothetical protein
MTSATIAAMLKAPSFSDEDIRKCKEDGDFSPILFEWYKFVGSLNVFVAHIQRDSPATKPVPPQHYHVLIGLLNRCARLMLSNVALSHEGKFGETTAIVDRCIFESAVKVIWLCTNPSQEKFSRYLADGLKTELEFKASIQANIDARGGQALPIETRMLGSIANHIRASGMTEAEIAQSKKLPDLASLLTTIGMDRLVYITAQKMGSHHIHGTWPSLLIHYLEEDPKGSFLFAPRRGHSSTHINQFMFVPLMVLAAMSAYADYIFQEAEEASILKGLFASTEEEVMRFYSEAFDNDLAA